MTEIGHRPPVRTLGALAALLLALAACTQPTTYPVSGAPCDPDDPVQDVANCIPPR
jgi:hypothetical protein